MKNRKVELIRMRDSAQVRLEQVTSIDAEKHKVQMIQEPHGIFVQGDKVALLVPYGNIIFAKLGPAVDEAPADETPDKRKKSS